jgi:hypothetical protein
MGEEVSFELKAREFWEVLEDDTEAFEFRSTPKSRWVMKYLAVLFGVLTLSSGAMMLETVTRTNVVECASQPDGSRRCELLDTSIYGTDVRSSVEMSDVRFVETSTDGRTGRVTLMSQHTSHMLKVSGPAEQVARRVRAIEAFARGEREESLTYRHSPGPVRSLVDKAMPVSVVTFFAAITWIPIFRIRWLRCRLSRREGTITIEQSNLFSSGRLVRDLGELEAIDMETGVEPSRLTSLLGREQWFERRVNRLIGYVTANQDPLETKYRILVRFADGAEVALNEVFDAKHADSGPLVERMRAFIDPGQGDVVW